jgi:TRAP-type C4-dicarboxylate transport system permease small subunit
MSSLSLVAKNIIKAGDFVSSYVCLPIMLFLIALDPFMRYMMGSPFFWSNEISTYLMVLVAFNSFGVVLAKEGHIRVTLIFGRLSLKVQNVLWVIISLAGLFYVSFLGYALIRLTYSSFTYRVRSATAEMLVFPWQIIATWGLIVFLVAMIGFTVNRIVVASRQGREGIRIDESIGY